MNILQELHKGRNNLQLLDNPEPKISTQILSLPSYFPLCIIAKAPNLSKRLSSIINKACVSPDEEAGKTIFIKKFTPKRSENVHTSSCDGKERGSSNIQQHQGIK
ncbi:hypothetical protein PVK06_032031 [Gossypium arboreum]|uniref:Uncharacterized protein n=1 Tax=Gossypium arboreum TaxID=29729 RepID=A0ABR0NTQ9_GOSAR|nr:hypothetical protein PVK06_032031 [Gossypium arboreum]